MVNAGVSGDTSSGGLARLDWSVSEETDAVIVELGANDALRGISPAVTEKALDAILGRLAGRGIPVLLCGMLAPPNMGADYTRAFNAIYPTLAERHKVDLYAFFLDGVAADRVPSTRPTACIRPPRAWRRSSRASCPRWRIWCGGHKNNGFSAMSSASCPGRGAA